MYKDINDSELLYLISENDFNYELLFNKYKPVINKICNKYLKSAKRVGYELDDLIQIANISLLLAVKNYKESNNILFYTYLIKSIDNNIITSIKKEYNNHNKLLNDAISYDEVLDGCDVPLIELIEDKSVIKPLDDVILEELEIEYIKYINSLPFEVAIVVEMKNCGFSSTEISKFLNIDKSTISKFMQFAKNRICLN